MLAVACTFMDGTYAAGCNNARLRQTMVRLRAAMRRENLSGVAAFVEWAQIGIGYMIPKMESTAQCGARVPTTPRRKATPLYTASATR